MLFCSSCFIKPEIFHINIHRYKKIVQKLNARRRRRQPDNKCTASILFTKVNGGRAAAPSVDKNLAKRLAAACGVQSCPQWPQILDIKLRKKVIKTSVKLKNNQFAVLLYYGTNTVFNYYWYAITDRRKIIEKKGLSSMIKLSFSNTKLQLLEGSTKK